MIFDYAAVPTAEPPELLGVRVQAPVNWCDMLAPGRESDTLPPATLAQLEEFLRDPMRRSRAQGGIP